MKLATTLCRESLSHGRKASVAGMYELSSKGTHWPSRPWSPTSRNGTPPELCSGKDEYT